MNIYLTLDEAAEALDLAPAAVHLLIRSGRLPGIYAGPKMRWRIRRDDLAAFMDEDLE